MSEPDAVEGRSEPPPSRPGRRWWRPLVGLTAALLLTELGAALVFAAATGQWFSYSAMRARRAELIASAPGERASLGPEPESERPRELSEQALHPYVGFINDPTGDPWASSPPFAHSAHLFEPASDALRVLVVGGSVAGQVRDEGAEALTAAIAEGPFAGREVITVSLAVGGYKQPQQLALVTYLLSVGAQFDVLINIDGFNEAALPWSENASAGVYPLYPRWWDVRLTGISEAEALADVGSIRVYRDLRRDASRAVEGSALRFSVTANVAWHALDRYAERRAYEHARSLSARTARGSYQRAGPAVELDRAQTLALAADNWARSSILLHQLAESRGFLYVHVLQPNQYVEGSKPLSDEERRLFHHPDTPYGRVAGDGYAALLAQAPRLRAEGVRFHDLTPIFQDEPRTLYKDDCCHYNQTGVDLLAARVGELVVEDAAADPGSASDPDAAEADPPDRL